MWKFGYDFRHFTPKLHPLARRKRILEAHQIDCVLDVGANDGSYGLELRDLNYSGRIVSFEPLTDAFTVLSARAERDPKWIAEHYALGDKPGEKTINIAKNSWSSSLLDMLPAHTQFAPQSKYIGNEKITVTTLDSVFPRLVQGKHVYLKIDTQGFEEQVLRGAEKSLVSIDTVQVEMSLIPLYRSQMLFMDMMGLMGDYGYALVALEPGFCDSKTGHVLQVDGIFHRANLNGSPSYIRA